MAEHLKDAGYYRLCAAEMMVKAQAAPSKATRRAYLNLALKCSQQALENSELFEAGAPVDSRQ
ncbi:MAG TPA: hypothetical protein VK515_06035 [Rhizomicrobium sp.]|nr:hypothetical protein [Rhizomicrobium sp.]